jgi:hypothetical protein
LTPKGASLQGPALGGPDAQRVDPSQAASGFPYARPRR